MKRVNTLLSKAKGYQKKIDGVLINYEELTQEQLEQYRQRYEVVIIDDA